MQFELPPLPFSKGALAPYLSEEAIEFHYEKHHKGYVKKLNELIAGTQFENLKLEEIITRSNGSIFNNAAQVWNHTFFWNSLTPQPANPSAMIQQRIEQTFDTFEKFRSVFGQLAMDVFGSGWIWLVENTKNGKLQLETSRNAENPLGSELKPLLTCDLWEHSYYIDYRNDRKRYLEALMKIQNWKFVENNLKKANVTEAA